MTAVTLVFPHQLFAEHPAVAAGRPIALIEDGLFFGDPHVGIPFHQQKIVLHRAAMKNYAAALEGDGHTVRYLSWRDGATVADHLETLRSDGFDEFHLCDPVDFLLSKRIHRWAGAPGIGATIATHDTPMFLTPAEVLETEFTSGRRPFMKRFYEAQRKRMGVLLEDDGSPTGGRWSLDDENRKPMPKRNAPNWPEIPHPTKDDITEEAINYVAATFPDYHGNAAGFAYPVTREAAHGWLDEFLTTRLERFGDYEDAIGRDEATLYHSVLTPALNIGLLTPGEIIEMTLARADAADTPLNSLEGFVRQVIGWREFMRGAYTHCGVEVRNGNFWGFEDKPVPAAFYDGTTGVEPVDTVIRRVLETGYCHHIERLMVLGNFFLLCRVHPRRVNDWFMELFIDAYDWVMVPNVFAMSQFADGGSFTTKPYLSGSNYVRKMSDYKKGPWCEIWDGLFWSFIADYSEFFSKQHRLAMMARQLERMAPEKLVAHRAAADGFLALLR